MNRSFENIFEKYNIDWKVPRKRFRNSKSLTQPFILRNDQLNFSRSSSLPLIAKNNLTSTCSVPDTRKSLYSNTSCYLNTNTKGKYFNPTRYQTLPTIKNKSLHHNLVSESQPDGVCDEKRSSKENNNEEKAYCSGNLRYKFEADLKNANMAGDNSQLNIIIDYNSSKNGCKKNNLNLSENSNYRKCINQSTSYHNLNWQSHNCDASFEKQSNFKSASSKQLYNSCTEPIQNSKNWFSKNPDTKETNSSTTQLVEENSTELDLLIQLIEQEEKTNKKIVKQNHDDKSQVRKSCLKGGYQELFERALKQEKVKSNFLKYDKKIGLRIGQLMTVVNVETFYGLTLATVKSKHLNNNFVVALTQEMAYRLKSGSQIEAFFDDKTHPYKLKLAGEHLDVYLEPNKLLIV